MSCLHLVFEVPRFQEDSVTEKSTFIAFHCRLTVYATPQSTQPQHVFQCWRRWKHFAAFDHAWSKIYPVLHDSFGLKKPPFYSALTKTSPELSNSRIKILSDYIRQLLKIKCTLEFVAQFLGIKDSSLINPKKADRKRTEEAVKHTTTSIYYT